jgi:glycosyltransferase involved in cell wall biosynthesis
MISLSVHLITYNNEKYIEETIESILKQKVNFNYEIIVGDDCSTDRTLSLIEKYKIKYPKLFKVFKNESQLGILKNFKSTLDKCSGDFVFPLAGDDLLKKENALQKMVDAISENASLGFVDCGFDKYYEDSNKTIPFANKKSIKFNKLDYKNAILLGKITPIGICFNRTLLLKYVNFKTYINKNITIDDYPILVDLVMHTDFVRINESLIIYRIYDDSFSHEKDFEKQYFLANQMKNLFDYFSKKYGFDNNITASYNKAHLKQLLFYAGFFEKKEVGKEVFSKIKSKSIKDYIHYLASQNKLFRKLVSLV